jgi:hypothetical protein
VLDLARQQEGDAGPAGHLDRLARALVARHPAEPAVVPSCTGAHRKSSRLDAVMDHRGDRNRAGSRGLMMGDRNDRDAGTDRSVHIVEVATEGPMRSCDGQQLREAFGIHRADDRVIVHDVATDHGVVCADHMSQFDHDLPELGPLGALEHPGLRYRTRAVARTEEQHVVAPLGEPARETINDGFRAAVLRRRHRQPRWCYQSDPQRSTSRSKPTRPATPPYPVIASYPDPLAPTPKGRDDAQS